MTELEFLVALFLLLIGFNLGYHEADKGLSLQELKGMAKKVILKLAGK